MEIKVPVKKVKVLGTNPLGRMSTLTFLPSKDTEKEQPTAILWQIPDSHEKPVPIGSSLVQNRRRRIALVQDRSSLEVIEHILPLRWFGILGFTLEGSGWPPYFGRAFEFFDALHPHLIGTGQKVHWFTTSAPVAFSHYDALGGYSTYQPSMHPGLLVRVSINFPGLGKYELFRSLPEDLYRIKKDMEAYTPGMPHWAYYPSLLGNYLGVWKHHKHVSWSYALFNDKALECFAQHRLIDLLGTLALIHPTRLLAGRVESVYGGHTSDLRLVKEIRDTVLNIENSHPRRRSACAPSP